AHISKKKILVCQRVYTSKANCILYGSIESHPVQRYTLSKSKEFQNLAKNP
ncbi:hypothetical protein L9F63_017143, partial [Diploptera punctata]